MAMTAQVKAELVLADVAREDGTPRHDPVKLASAYADLLVEPVAHDVG